MKYKIRDLIKLPEKITGVYGPERFEYNKALDAIGEIEVEVNEKIISDILNRHTNWATSDIAHIIACRLPEILKGK